MRAVALLLFAASCGRQSADTRTAHEALVAAYEASLSAAVDASATCPEAQRNLTAVEQVWAPTWAKLGAKPEIHAFHCGSQP